MFVVISVESKHRECQSHRSNVCHIKKKGQNESTNTGKTKLPVAVLGKGGCSDEAGK